MLVERYEHGPALFRQAPDPIRIFDSVTVELCDVLYAMAIMKNGRDRRGQPIRQARIEDDPQAAAFRAISKRCASITAAGSTL